MNKFFTSMFLLFFFLACEEQVLEQVENQESVESRLSSQNQSCVPKSVSYQECSDFKPYAKEASIILTCSDDGSTRFASECLVKSCSPGYINIGNNCVRQNCSPNSSFTVDCSVELQLIDLVADNELAISEVQELFWRLYGSHSLGTHEFPSLTKPSLHEEIIQAEFELLDPLKLQVLVIWAREAFGICDVQFTFCEDCLHTFARQVLPDW